LTIKRSFVTKYYQTFVRYVSFNESNGTKMTECKLIKPLPKGLNALKGFDSRQLHLSSPEAVWKTWSPGATVVRFTYAATPYDYLSLDAESKDLFVCPSGLSIGFTVGFTVLSDFERCSFFSAWVATFVIYYYHALSRVGR
jgi:hypothetical protein